MQKSLRHTKLVRMLTETEKSLDNLNARFTGTARGPVRAKVIDVDDPQERGRVRVIFDAMNPEDVPQFEGAGEYSLSRDGEMAFESHWIDVSPPFKGKQAPGLVGKRVQVILSNNQYQYAVLQDVLCDPDVLTEEAAGKLELPNNSTMTRLSIYPADNLPPPEKFNIGCMVVEEGGPMNSDWLCVCLKRDGKHIWVRHGDLAHGHAGGNDITSQVSAEGIRPGNGQIPAIWDYTFPTSQMTMYKHSAFGTNFRGNPFGDLALWHAPPNGVDGDGNKIEPLPIQPAQLFDQNKALDFVRESGYIQGNIQGAFTNAFAPAISAATSSIPGYNVAGSLIEKGQEAWKFAESAKQVIENPLFVQDVALSAATNYVTDATKATISGSNGVQGLINTVYSSALSALGSLI